MIDDEMMCFFDDNGVLKQCPEFSVEIRFETQKEMEAFESFLKKGYFPVWVDAKKTLPEDGQEVLVTEDYDGKRAVKKATYYRMSPYWHKHVVAWMAMPEAYDG